jgi:RHS repeat-associated protein
MLHTKYFLTIDDYRYGFNGMEKDDEVKGVTGSSYDFGARMYDPRIGRWLARDPFAAKYTGLSPYNFVGNSPVLLIDPNGKEIFIKNPETGESHLYVPNETATGSASGSFVQIVAQTLDDLSTSGKDVNGIIKTLAGDDSRSDINSAAWDSHIGNSSGKITWSPEGGIVTDEGGRQSPDIGLLHELGHTYYQKYDPEERSGDMPKLEDYKSAEEWNGAMDKYEEVEKGETQGYDGYEEKWVIEKVENPGAKKSGQSERKEHHYKEKYKAKTPSSTSGPTESELK